MLSVIFDGLSMLDGSGDCFVYGFKIGEVKVEVRKAIPSGSIM